MIKYKAGDKIRIKKGLNGDSYYDGLLFNRDMEKYSGKEFVIKKLREWDSYYVLDGISDRVFNDAMVECKVEDKVVLKDINFKKDALYLANVGSDIYILVKDGKMNFTKDTVLSTSTGVSLVDYEIKKLNELVEEDGSITDRKVRIISDLIEGDADLTEKQVQYFIGFQSLKNIIKQITDIYDPIVAVNVLIKSDFYSVEE